MDALAVYRFSTFFLEAFGLNQLSLVGESRVSPLS